MQGRRLQVFQLDYVAAADIEKTVQGLLSPAGRAFIIESSPMDRRRTRETIAVEDVPEVLDRIIAYITQVDHPPRQVLIEAKVLQITLSDELQHGINFDNLLKIANTNINVRTVGFANASASPALLVGLDGNDVGAIIEALEKTTDAKTLASPKVLAVNGQEARIQIGSQLGYFVTTSTQTSALQSVKFLEVGVVLKVTPTISRDGQILMTVMPEVSTGRINATSGLPEEETTELTTTVLLQDGKGMVIGGLIQETNRNTQSKVPVLGDIWGIGHLFRRINTSRIRSEIIVVLLPRIVPYSCEYKAYENFELEKAHTPLLENGIYPADRSHLEPELPDSYLNPRLFSCDRARDAGPSFRQGRLKEPRYYLPARSELDPIPRAYDCPIYTPYSEGALFQPLEQRKFSSPNPPAYAPPPEPAPALTPLN